MICIRNTRWHHNYQFIFGKCKACLLAYCGKQKVTLQQISCVNIFLSIWSIICSKRIHIINIPVFEHARKCYSKTRVSCVHFCLCTLVAIGVVTIHFGVEYSHVPASPYPQRVHGETPPINSSPCSWEYYYTDLHS